MEEDYLKSCRFCLKKHNQLQNLYSVRLVLNNELILVDFVKEITHLKILKGEFLPSQICSACIEMTEKIYSFVQTCIISDNILKKYETRREFRKIEQEALLEESNECEELELAQKNSLKDQDVNKFVQNPEKNVTFDKKDLKPLDNALSNIEDICELKENDEVKSYQNFQSPNQNLEKNGNEESKEKSEEKLLELTEKPFRCSECPQTFSKQVHLAVHIRCHTSTDDRPFSCKFCGKQYMYEYLVKQHELKHTGDRPFPCSVCHKGCFSQNSLKRHMVVHSDSYVKKLHQCKVCKKTFSFPSYLVTHMKVHNGERPHLCATCGKSYKQLGQLHVHQRIHTGFRPYMCQLCKEKFICGSKLKLHMLKHTKEKPYICEQCGTGFRQSYDLKMHIRIHSNEKPVQCTVCGKKMATTGQLTVHLRTHTGERPYSCKVCKKSFSTNTTLVKHFRLHSGEKPYKCDVCLKNFAQYSILKNHKKTHDSSVLNSNIKQQRKPKNKTKKRQSVNTANCIKKQMQDKDVGKSIILKENLSSQSNTNILTLTGGATVSLAVTGMTQDHFVSSEAAIGYPNEGEVEQVVILPAPIPLLTKE